MQEVANVVGMSQSQFTRRFKSVIGMLPVVYLTRTRLQKARHLLLDTDHTLDYSGYQNGFYFSRVFVKVMKMSPSEYRKAHRI
jgi:AraC-like DNA-binding protein